MKFSENSIFYDGVYAKSVVRGLCMPMEYVGAREEYLACRTTAWLQYGLTVLFMYEVSGPDSAKLLNQVCVNRDFSKMKPGNSKHAIICNEKGNMVADGVIMYVGDTLYRTYAMAPILAYYVEKSNLDVTGKYVHDEYLFQLDGPKSLEILEEATQTDLHDIKFAKNKKVKICETDMVVHRLGMSGCLAYEMHGAAKDAEVVYTKLREVTEKYGGKMLGSRHYIVLNHTPAGYPNQAIHYLYDHYSGEPDFVEFTRKNCFPQIPQGSAIVQPELLHVTPYDVGWGYLVNMDHDFVGKEALMEIKKSSPRQAVTLEWNTEDVGEVFMSQFRGREVEPYEPIEAYHDFYNAGTSGFRGDLVLAGDKVIGSATGRCYAFYERHMISLAFIAKEYAVEGTELEVLWGRPEYPQKRIRAKVARFPYYNEEYRNETFDVENIPHPGFPKAEETE